MKYLVTCGDLKYEAENRKQVLKIIRDLILPFIQIKADIKITKLGKVEKLDPSGLFARTMITPKSSTLSHLLNEATRKHRELTKRKYKKRRKAKKK